MQNEDKEQAKVDISKRGKGSQRNRLCLCGSGKKYKRCCLNKDKIPSNLTMRRVGDGQANKKNNAL